MTTRAPVAIGDIHGRLDLLDAAIAAFPDRHLVLLGDYCDRGPDSRGCIQRVRELVEIGRATACMGNHDLWMIEGTLKPLRRADWLRNGGSATLESYGDDLNQMETDAIWMLTHLKPVHIAGNTLFSHALRPDPSGRDTDAHLWGRPGDTPVYPLPEGVTVSVHGHTPARAPWLAQADDGTHLWFIDTGACFWGVLTALDCETFIPHSITL